MDERTKNNLAVIGIIIGMGIVVTVVFYFTIPGTINNGSDGSLYWFDDCCCDNDSHIVHISGFLYAQICDNQMIVLDTSTGRIVDQVNLTRIKMGCD